MSFKKIIMYAVTIAVSLIGLTAFASAARLDSHTGIMVINSPSIQTYKDSGCTNQNMRYICASDWFNDNAQSAGGNYNLTYPITVALKVGDHTATYTEWFRLGDISSYGDGGTGSFTGLWNPNAWYNYVPTIGYNDDHPGNDVRLYVQANNGGFWTTGADGNGNRRLYCGSNPIMYAACVLHSCYYNPGDTADADYAWHRSEQTFGEASSGLVQGYNMIYYAGSDGSCNYLTGQQQFLYDTVPPNIYFNSNPSGWTAGNPTFSFGATDATSGVAHIWYRTTTDGSNWSGWTESSSCTLYNSGWYQVQVMSCDYAGNYSYATSNWVGVDHALPAVSYSPNSCGWTNSQTVGISAWDTWGSGLNSSYWRLSTDGGSTWSGYTQFGSNTTISLPQGDDVLQTDAYDNVGNKQTVTSGHFYIDKSPPSATFSPNSCSWRGTPFDVTLQPTDTGGSGVKSYIYRISSDNGNTWGAWSAVKVGPASTAVTLTGSGTAVIQAQVTDNAGNVGTVTSGLYQLGVTLNISLQPPNAGYLTDTDVITSARVKDLNDGGITPDMNATVQLTVKKSDGSVYTSQSKAMICPGNDSNLIWFRWHTPAAADTLTVTATINCNAAAASSVLADTLNWDVKVPTENTPPATAFTDKPPTWFSPQTPPGSGLPSSLSWSDYIYQGGTFVQRKYTASLSASLSTTPSKNASGSVRIETATDTGGVWQMKSGYPVNEQATSGVTVSSTTGAAVDAQCATPAQLAEGRYPEFNYWYGGYFRLFEPISNGSFQLRQNPYSQYNDRVHYTPVWFPDGPYTTLVTVSQAWTPAGAMGADATDTLQISGALPQDWYTRILQ